MQHSQEPDEHTTRNNEGNPSTLTRATKEENVTWQTRLNLIRRIYNRRTWRILGRLGRLLLDTLHMTSLTVPPRSEKDEVLTEWAQSCVNNPLKARMISIEGPVQPFDEFLKVRNLKQRFESRSLCTTRLVLACCNKTFQRPQGRITTPSSRSRVSAATSTSIIWEAKAPCSAFAISTPAVNNACPAVSLYTRTDVTRNASHSSSAARTCSPDWQTSAILSSTSIWLLLNTECHWINVRRSCNTHSTRQNTFRPLSTTGNPKWMIEPHMLRITTSHIDLQGNITAECSEIIERQHPS